MHACPSCGAPLDAEGSCSSCGALARSWFRGLELGAPQLAQAVARGFDFYALLGIDPQATPHQIAKRYRQLRMLFPDDPSRLQEQASRKLQLLEVAGRALTDPKLRVVYDQLRSERNPQLLHDTVRCASCGAPLAADAAFCSYCGTARPAGPELPSAPPEPSPELPPPAEPIDFYAMIGVTPAHLFQVATEGQKAAFIYRELNRRNLFNMLADNDEEIGVLQPKEPLKPSVIDEATRQRQHQILLSGGMTNEEREAKVLELEVARRILITNRWRVIYDGLLRDFYEGRFDNGQLDTLHYLQAQARAEIAEERGELPSPEEAAIFLRQGRGYLETGLSGEAIEPLRLAVKAMPDSAEAHAAYARAILTSDDPVALGAHQLRQALMSLEWLEARGASQEPWSGLCRGLLARDRGDLAEAERELQQVVAHDSRMAVAWRALAGLALGRGATDEALQAARRALAVDAQDERTLLLIVGACLQARRRNEATEAAAQIAQIRGQSTTAEMILAEMGG